MFSGLKRRPLVRSALALFSSAMLGRVLGTVYRVALVRVAGQDTIGLIQLALPVYRIARSLATLGLPVAIAKTTAERTQLQGQIDLSAYHLGMKLMLRAALVGFLLQAVFSRFWAYGVLADGRTEMAVIVLAALLVPIAVSAALHGVIQGLQRQHYMAGSDVAEVLVRIPVTLALVKLAVPYGPAWAAAAVAVGYIAGEAGCLAVLSLGLRRTVRAQRPAARRANLPPLRIRELLQLGVPLMLTGLLNNILSLVTVAMVPRLLVKAGCALSEATRQYGRVTGMAVPTLYMPMMLIFPVTQVVLPEITRLAALPGGAGRARMARLLRKAYGGALAVTALVIPLLWLRAEWLGTVLYGDASVGALIRPLSAAAPFTYLGAVSAGVLYGLGKTTWTMGSSMAGNAVRVALVGLLAGRPEWGITGVLWAFIADCIVTAVCQIAGAWVALRARRK